jgi:hypothetical protein
VSQPPLQAAAPIRDGERGVWTEGFGAAIAGDEFMTPWIQHQDCVSQVHNGPVVEVIPGYPAANPMSPEKGRTRSVWGVEGTLRMVEVDMSLTEPFVMHLLCASPCTWTILIQPPNSGGR